MVHDSMGNLKLMIEVNKRPFQLEELGKYYPQRYDAGGDDPGRGD